MTLQSKSIDLSKHVGQKVSVTGVGTAMGMAKPDAAGTSMPKFEVNAIKMIATSCGG